jgi:tetratricopeptide (TPR) repeat protein
VREGWKQSSFLPTGVIFLLIAAQPGLAQQAPLSSMPVSELVERGRAYLQNREPERARRLLEEAVARAPKSSAAWSFLADSYAQLGLEEKAVEGYRTALELHPDLPNALYNLGILLMKRQRFDDAARYFQALRRQQPQDQDVPVLLAQCQLQLGRHKEAIALLEEAVRRPKAGKAAYLSLASAYIATSQNIRAVDVLHEARIHWPADGEINSALTGELMLTEDPAGALASIGARRGMKLAPDDFVLLAGCYAGKNRLEEARRFAEQAVAGGGGEPALLALANILQLEGRNQEVIKLLEPQRKQFSTSAKYLFTLGVSYYNVGNYSGARDLFSTATSMAPSLAQAYYFEGNALTRLGKPELALAPYAEAVRLSPDKHLYHFHFGLALSNLGQKGPGEEQLKRAVEINGSFAPARYELARIYSGSSRDDLAREQLEEAIKAEPDYLSSYYLLSQVYSRLGMREDAARMLEQFRTLQRKQHEEEKRALTGSGSKGPNP